MRRNFILLLSLTMVVFLTSCGKDGGTDPNETSTDHWFSLPPLNNAVGAMTVFNGDLVVGGNFTQADGISMNHLARWDGSNWQDIGGGVSDGSQNITTVYALTVYNNKLIVAGRFNQAGSISARNIAAWDGNSWTALGSGIDATALNQGAMCLEIYQGNLIVGGVFNQAGGIAAEDIAYWNGSAWSEFAGGFSGGLLGGSVHSLFLFDNNLVSAGSFTKADTTTVSNIAVWNGASWSNLDSGIDGGIIWDLATFENKLVAGGDFSKAGGADASRIALWDRTNWTTCSSGMNKKIECLTIYNEQLIAGGLFSDAGGSSAAYIARWDGSSWSALGKGVSEGFGLTFVSALQVHQGKLYVGGSFTKAGEKSVGHIAGWQE